MSDLVTNLNIKQPDGSYESHDIGVEAENVIGLEDVIEDMEAKITTSFKGTHAEWEALTTEEKAQYTEVIFTDDYTNESVMQGATGNADGAEGMVPQPLTGDQNKVLFGDGTWKRINNDITNLAPAYDSTFTYAVDDLVTHIDSEGSGKLYKCIVAVTNPEAFNINKWDDVTASDVFTTRLVKTIIADGVKTTNTLITELLDDITLNDNSYIKINDNIYRYNYNNIFSNFSIGGTSESVYLNIFSATHCREIIIDSTGNVSSTNFDTYAFPDGTIFELYS